MYDTTVGRLIWILPTQPRIASDISQLTRRRTNAHILDYNRMRAMIVSMREKPQRIKITRLSREIPLKLNVAVHAGGSETVMPPLKQRHQQCVLVMLGEDVPPAEPCKIAIVDCASDGTIHICHFC